MTNPYRVNEIQLSYKYHMKPSDMPKIGKSQDAYNIFLATWDDNSLDLFEQSKIMLLNRAGRVLGIYHVGNGSIASAPMETRLALVAALKTNAASIIIAHNHPSGNKTPSEADKNITKKFQGGCQLLDIQMLDHIIVCRDGYYSFSEGMSFEKVERGSGVYYEALMPY